MLRPRAALAVVRRTRPSSGTRITDASLRAGRLAIASVRLRGRRAIRIVELRSVRSGRLLFHRASSQARSGAQMPTVEVVVSDDGDLAWSVNGRLFARVRKLVHRVTDERAFDLALEDGRTMRWTRENDLVDYTDLRPVRGKPCPSRSRFRPVLDTGGVVVTRATYDASQTELFALRGCVNGTGHEVLLGSGYLRDSDAEFLDVVAASAPFVVLAAESYDRNQGCGGMTVSTVSLRSGDVARLARTAPTGPNASCPQTRPTVADPSAITARGAYAWLHDGVLRATGTGGFVELDRGSITNLRAEGDTVRWTRDGAERSAVP